MTFRLFWILLLALAAPTAASAELAPFDLAGPVLRVQVTRGGVTLPVSEVPNLSAGDQLSIRADLPADQSVHYLLVAVFLRGSTNPPPAAWFYRSETWTPKGHNGLRITAPADAQQAIVFLAPQTGGDFRALIDAVRGRPGAFVRASQDLNEASLDRSRLDAFLQAIRRRDPAEPDRLSRVSPLLARSLAIKLNADCLQKSQDLQAACLMQGQDDLILSDGHSTSMVEALTSGASADLSLQLSATPQAGFGYASPYVAAVMDMARILDSFRTAQYQYIPAIATAEDDRLNLVLNTPPSFHNPMSVIVAALPAIGPSETPPLQLVDQRQAYCLGRPDLVLPLDGAPIAYSTRYLHDVVLRVTQSGGKVIDLPLKADAERGGYRVDAGGVDPAALGGPIDGTIHALWGFQPFDGPRVHLESPASEPWRLSAADRQALVVGRDDTVHLQGDGTACVDGVALQQPSGQPQQLDWRPAPDGQIAVTVPLGTAQPGTMALLVKQHGVDKASAVGVQAFAQAARLDSFTLHAGDVSGVLSGTRLDEVAQVALGGVDFRPGVLSRSGAADQLTLSAPDGQGDAALRPGQAVVAQVGLKDGRVVNLDSVIAPPRPKVVLIGRNVQPAPPKGAGAIHLADPAALPQGAQLTFSIRAEEPARLTGKATVEVAAPGGMTAILGPANGLTLEDDRVALLTLDPAKAFPSSTFGPLQFRIVDSGGAGDWQPLATLMRLPVLESLACGAIRGECTLTGENLFLIDSVAGDAAFANPVKVAEGFTGSMLQVPRPVDGRLYVKLHDAPAAIDEVTFSRRH